MGYATRPMDTLLVTKTNLFQTLARDQKDAKRKRRFLLNEKKNKIKQKYRVLVGSR